MNGAAQSVWSTIHNVGGQPFAVAPTPSGAEAYVTTNSTTSANGRDSVAVVDVATGTVVDRIEVYDQPRDVDYDPFTGTVLVANGGTGGVLSVIDPGTNTVLIDKALAGNPLGLAARQDQIWFADYGTSRVLRYQRGPGVLDTAITVGDFPWYVKISPNGRYVYVTGEASASVTVIDTADVAATPTTITVGTGPRGLALNPAGDTLYVANHSDGTVSVIATATNTVVGGVITVGGGPQDVVVSPDGAYVFVSDEINGTIIVIEAATRTVLGSVTVGATPFGLAVLNIQ